MDYKENYEVLGAIIEIAANGLSVFAGANGARGKARGGRVGDMVAKRRVDGAIKIIDAQDWEVMPKNLNDAKKRGMFFGAEDVVALRNEIAALKKKNAELESKIKSQNIVRDGELAQLAE